MRFLLKDTNGKHSASYTMMIATFLVVLLWLLLSIFAKLGHIEIRAFSGAEAMQMLSHLYFLYFGRRYTDTKNELAAKTETVSKE